MSDSAGAVPLLLLSVPPDVMLEEQTLPGDVGRVLPVLVVVQLLAWLPSALRFRIHRRLLCVCVSVSVVWGGGQKTVSHTPLHLATVSVDV